MIEVGCGYGTFIMVAAKRIQGLLSAFTIEQDMIEITQNKAGANELYRLVLNFNHQFHFVHF